MSGRTLNDAISILDEENNDLALNEEEEIDIQEYDEVEESDDDAPLGYEEDHISADYTPPAFVPTPREFEIPSYTPEIGNVLRRGDVVELEDDSGRMTDNLLSGDFLFVHSIIERMSDGEVLLRGYRLRRCSYLKPLFDAKFNELFMLLEVREHDPRPRFVQGLEDIAPEKVKRKRNCIFTNLDYDVMNVRQVNTHAPARLKSQSEMKEWLFKYGKLVCRWVYIVELHPTAQSYGGEARRMYKREVTDFNDDNLAQWSSMTDSTGKQACADMTCSLDHSRNSDSHKRRADSSDLQLGSSIKRLQHTPKKSKQLILGDGYCGCGGLSEGARQAGYQIGWGLELDSRAMAAYRKNFPEAISLEMDAHDFKDVARRCTHGCDHLHMSCPCCYWSESHTVDGQNDEANMLTIFTVGPWLRKLKPPTFSLEQAPGLLKLAKHRLYFRSLINDILSSGYRVRWRVQDQAWFGVGQHRRRLIFIGAKIGIPLPPFPAPVHGPPKSGLKRLVTIEDSLKTMERQAMSFRDDPYHQPHKEKRLDKPAFDPHVNLAKCVTTSGGDNAHYSGTRANTVRELASFQGFPPKFHFTGPVGEAKKQCGNAWPVKANKTYLLLWAATREAFDHGFIDEEDEILDLYEHLEAKGVTIPRPPSIDLDLLDERPSRVGSSEPQFRYLTRIEKTVKPRFPLSLWGKRVAIDPMPQRKKKRVAPRFLSLVDGLLDGIEEVADSVPRRSIPGRRRRRTAVYIDDEE